MRTDPDAARSFDVARPFDVDIGLSRVVFGAGGLSRIGELAAALGGQRVLLVTDPGVREAGHCRRAVASLIAAGLAVEVFDSVAENPATGHVEAAAERARQHGADLLVGLGGGSAMDVAKSVNFLVTSGGRLVDYWGRDKARAPMLPSIGIPTTAGTGSEAQSFALITQEETHRKMAIGHRMARFRTVLLDPELTATAPPRVVAITGLDAIGHAVESQVSIAANPLSRAWARAAFAHLDDAFDEAISGAGAPLAARARMQLGAFLAGAAIEASMLGAAHAAANPLTARHGVVHGLAVALMLPHVVRFNGAAAAVAAGYAELLAGSGSGRRGGSACGDGRGTDPETATERLAARIATLVAAARLPRRLGDCGVTGRDLDDLAREASSQWTARYNPRPVDHPEFLELYRAAS